MTARVVGVHGIGNRQAGRTPDEAAAILGGRWTPAIRRGLGTGSRVETVVAYYAHRLAAETAQGGGDPAHLAEPEQRLLLAWTEALGAPAEVAQGRLTQPARAAQGVRRWINIADPGDFIAVPRCLTGSFAGIDADLTAPVGVFNFHKVTGYLSCTTTAAALATLLGH